MQSSARPAPPADHKAHPMRAGRQPAETTTTMLESIVTMAQGMNDAERQQLLEAGKSILLVRDLRNMADNKPA